MQPNPIQSIPLNQLKASASNVRKTPTGAQALAELKASIQAHGLLENLIVRPLNAKGVVRYGVIAGGRRLAALNELVRDGVLEADFEVSCRVLGESDRDEEVSLAENVVRVPMHPADQVVVFAGLIEAKSTVNEISARFGVSKRIVEQRLRLGTVAPEILDAYRKNVIDLECVKAFSVTTDQQRQLSAWQEVQHKDHYGGPSAWSIKRILTEDHVSAGSSLAKFVGRRAYKAAGGTVTADLFAAQHEDGTWFNDAAILRRLAQAKLKKVADKLRSCWKWVDIHLEVDWETKREFGRIPPTPGELSSAEQDEKAQLVQRLAELDATRDGDESSSSRYRKIFKIEERLSTLERVATERGTFSEQHRAVSGCIVTIGHDHKVEILQGLVRREDVPAAEALESESNQALNAPPAPSVDPSVTARKQVGVGTGLADDLRAIRNSLIKSRLAGNFSLALDLVVFQLARSVFGGGYYDKALDIDVRPTPECPYERNRDKQFHGVNVGARDLEVARESLPLDWLKTNRPGEAFAQLRSLPQLAKEALFAASVARTLKGQLGWEPGALPQVEQVVDALAIDFAAEFRPPAELYWQRITKGKILEVARSTLGNAWAKAHEKDKKRDLAQAMEKAFAAGDDLPAGLTPEGRTAALGWAPPGFAADVGDDGSDTGAADAESDSPEGSAAGSDAVAA